MTEFSGFVQIIPQTEEEEFYGRALALSTISDWDVEGWFKMCESHDPRFKNPEYVERLKAKAKELGEERFQCKRGVQEILDQMKIFCEDNESFDYNLKRLDFDKHEVEVDYCGRRYIISVRSKEGLEEVT